MNRLLHALLFPGLAVMAIFAAAERLLDLYLDQKARRTRRRYWDSL